MPENAIEHYRESWIPGRRQGPAGQSLKPIDGAASRFGCNARGARKNPRVLEKRLERVSAMRTAGTVMEVLEGMEVSGKLESVWLLVCCLFRGLFLSETTE
jgi:hypothetical protein